MTSWLDRGGRHEAVGTMGVRAGRTGRGVRRGQLDRASHTAGQLDARHLGGLAARGHRRGLAWRLPPLPVAEAMKNLVRTLRSQRNLAQGQLADAMGVSRQTINSIETGRYTPSLPLAMALARYFGVTVEEMFDDQGC